MTLLRDTVSLFRKAASERPAQTPTLANLMSMVGQNLGLIPQMQAYGQSAVLFSIVNLIGEAVAQTEWQLFEGDRELESHPFLELWDRPNPFTRRFNFLQAIQQHLDLVGEFWWVIVQDRGQIELWPVRPDRMRPLPHPTDIVTGYEYRIGQRRIELALEDVVFERMPNPLDWYRGIGPVGALLVDLQGEKAAIDWQRNFLRNDATPGGVMQLEDSLSDAEFEKHLKHWEMNHKGVSNAGRVAFVERATFTPMQFSHRDMQFEQLRRFNIDLFLLAYRVHPHMLGKSESVNRANAEAAEESFARWVIKPRLQRIAGVVNEQLLPMFGDNLELRFVDPTPQDRDRDLAEAERGFKSKLLTKNEGRQLLGYDEVEGGDEFAADPVSPFGDFSGSDGSDEDEELEEERFFGPRLHRAQDDDLIESPVQAAETAINRGWQKRLQRELKELSEFISERMKGWAPIVKIEVSDLDGYDWDWFNKYGDEVEAELARAFQEVVMLSMPDIALPRAQQLAVEFAQFRSAQLLKLDGELSMVRQTREHVRRLVADTIEQGQSLQTLRRQLQDDLMFSRKRAETVARTETRIAMGQGQKGAAVEQGRDEKRWLTQGKSDPRVDPVCLSNEAQGWISIENPFQGGVDTVPQHPSCMCTVIYRTSEQHLSVQNGKCPECNAGLVANKDGPGLYCRRCKRVLPWPEAKSGKGWVVNRDGYGRISGVRED